VKDVSAPELRENPWRWSDRALPWVLLAFVLVMVWGSGFPVVVNAR
jgi:hypothetical protein